MFPSATVHVHAAMFKIARVRRCLPPPHVALHAPHPDQRVSLHGTKLPFGSTCVSTAHGFCAQYALVVCTRCLHSRPPNAASVSTLRVRWRMPRPHVFEHTDHEPQGPRTQSMGQITPVRHFAYFLVSTGQVLPPFCAPWSLCRTRIL